MSEHFLTGYCRQTDQSRMVEVLVENGQLEEADCCYGNCPFQSQCTIAMGIAELLEQSGTHPPYSAVYHFYGTGE